MSAAWLTSEAMGTTTSGRSRAHVSYWFVYRTIMLLHTTNVSAHARGNVVSLLAWSAAWQRLCVTKLFQNVPLHDRKVRGGQLIMSCILLAAAREYPRMPFQRTLCRTTAVTRARSHPQIIALRFWPGATLGNDACCPLPTAIAKRCCLMEPV